MLGFTTLFIKNHERRSKRRIQTEDSYSTILEDVEVSKRFRQNIKVVGRTIYCLDCLSDEPGSHELAGFYCACGSFLCSLHIIGHKCQVSQAMEYQKELTAALA
jgi:hypothetical protein